MVLFLLKGLMNMFEIGFENEVFYSCDEVRKFYMMILFLLYNMSIDVLFVFGFVFYVIFDWKEMY